MNRDKGKLKSLASDSKRSAQVNSFKSATFLGTVLDDHKKVIKKNKDEVMRDIECSVFSHKPTMSIRSVSKGVLIDAHLEEQHQAGFKSRTRSQVNDYQLRYAVSYPNPCHYRPRHDLV